jgi:Na+/H+ antiporter NhaA
MFDEALGRLHALGASAAALLLGLLVGLVVFALGLLMARGVPTAHGWAIPAATDIAFALGVISLLGNRVPPSLRVFLTALAISDDLGAVVIIALFYTAGISLPDLAGAAAVLALLVAMNRFGLPLDALVAPVTLGVGFGLVVGKVVGVLGCSPPGWAGRTCLPMPGACRWPARRCCAASASP